MWCTCEEHWLMALDGSVSEPMSAVSRLLSIPLSLRALRSAWARASTGRRVRFDVAEAPLFCAAPQPARQRADSRADHRRHSALVNAEDYRAVVATVKPEFISSEGYLVGVQALAMTGDGITVFQRRALEDALAAYGEDDVLSAVRAGLRRDQVEAIGRIHCRLIHETDPAGTDRAGYAQDKALAVAAVEVLEGKPRALVRKRRSGQNVQ